MKQGEHIKKAHNNKSDKYMGKNVTKMCSTNLASAMKKANCVKIFMQIQKTCTQTSLLKNRF